MSSKEGIVLVDKPAGITSHDVVNIARRKFGIRKIGHAGTLDPMATGLLILMIGGYTRKSVFFSGYDKEYEAGVFLGISTETGDREGKIIQERDWSSCLEDERDIDKVFSSFLGEIEQVPPMFSAKKIRGKKLYELARKGLTVKRDPRTVVINEIRLLKASFPHFSFYVSCSKGTYIRQLAHDFGEKLGCGAHLVSLRRTRIGPYDIKKAVPLDRVSHEDISRP